MKISVVIPLYNAESTILATLNSVLSQTVKPYEVIIVNDGSTDNSFFIVDRFIKECTVLNFHYIQKHNGGVSTARNIGMEKAKGDWIALLDSDDVWLPSKLERQVEILCQNPTIDFLGCNRNGEYFDKFLFKKISFIQKINPKTFLLKNFLPVPTVIFKKSILDTVGFFDERQRYAEEGNFFIRIANQHNVYLLNESLVMTGGGKPDFGHSGLSGNLWAMEKGELKNIKDCLKLKVINIIEYPFYVLFSLLKFIRRVLIVKFR
jgi:glycosyltransferase involved in cell wall biosynthesis